MGNLFRVYKEYSPRSQVLKLTLAACVKSDLYEFSKGNENIDNICV